MLDFSFTREVDDICFSGEALKGGPRLGESDAPSSLWSPLRHGTHMCCQLITGTGGVIPSFEIVQHNRALKTILWIYTQANDAIDFSLNMYHKHIVSNIRFRFRDFTQLLQTSGQDEEPERYWYLKSIISPALSVAYNIPNNFRIICETIFSPSTAFRYINNITFHKRIPINKDHTLWSSIGILQGQLYANNQMRWCPVFRFRYEFRKLLLTGSVDGYGSTSLGTVYTMWSNALSRAWVAGKVGYAFAQRNLQVECGIRSEWGTKEGKRRGEDEDSQERSVEAQVEDEEQGDRSRLRITANVTYRSDGLIRIGSNLENRWNRFGVGFFGEHQIAHYRNPAGVPAWGSLGFVFGLRLIYD